MSFWGVVLKPGQKKAVQFPNPTDILHLSQACLHEPKQGKNYLQVEVEGTTYSIACLEKDKREHDCLDLFFDDEKTTFVCKGSSEIHLMGYMEPQRDDALFEESEEEPQPVVPKKASPKAAPVPSPKVAAALSPKGVSPKVSPKAVLQAAADDDSYEYEDEEEEEEGRPLDDDDDDEFLEEEGEEEEMEDMPLEDEFEESESEPPVQQTKLSPKHGATQSPKHGATQSPKRAAAEPAAPPAKKGKTEASGGDEAADYIKKLVAYLKANGKTTCGQLGSKVPRPNGVPKMKALFEQNKDKFTVVGDMVTLK